MEHSKVEFKPGATDGKVYEVLCVECKRPTRHEVGASLRRDGQAWDRSEQWSVEWTDDYQVVKCLGCETVTFRHTAWFSEDDPHDGTTERLYPKRDANTVAAKSFGNVPTALRRLYGEVVDAFNNESLILCAGGLRALVEGICADRGITDGPVEVPAKGGGTQTKRFDNLVGKIAGLHEKGLLTKDGTEILHELRFLGNEALHELAAPGAGEVRLATTIIEHVLEQLYEIPEKGLELQRTRAKRSPAVAAPLVAGVASVAANGPTGSPALVSSGTPSPGAVSGSGPVPGASST
jgi:hypothetical protein